MIAEPFMAAQVLLWLLDSPDGHAKNYSIFIDVNDGYYLNATLRHPIGCTISCVWAIKQTKSEIGYVSHW